MNDGEEEGEEKEEEEEEEEGLGFFLGGEPGGVVVVVEVEVEAMLAFDPCCVCGVREEGEGRREGRQEVGGVGTVVVGWWWDVWLCVIYQGTLSTNLARQ